MRILKDEKAQVSAEMLVIIAAVIAIALLLVTNLVNTAKTSNDTIKAKSSSITDKIGELEV